MRYAATYVLLASSLQPLKATYTQALGILRKVLPPNGIMTGKLRASHRAPHSDAWRSASFVLTHDRLVSLPDERATPPLRGGYLAGLTPGVAMPFAVPDPPPAASCDELSVDVTDVSQILPIMDPSLPEGHAFWVCLRSKPQGLYFVAEHEEDAEAWVDAITLVSHIMQARVAVEPS